MEQIKDLINGEDRLEVKFGPAGMQIPGLAEVEVRGAGGHAPRSWLARPAHPISRCPGMRAASALPRLAVLALPMPGVVQVTTAEQAWGLLQTASAARHAAETLMNAASSRSHCLLCLRVDGKSRLTSESGDYACAAAGP
jgi:hypothetical protein